MINNTTLCQHLVSHTQNGKALKHNNNIKYTNSFLTKMQLLVSLVTYLLFSLITITAGYVTITGNPVQTWYNACLKNTDTTKQRLVYHTQINY
jgi:hypothetical protein